MQISLEINFTLGLLSFGLRRWRAKLFVKKKSFASALWTCDGHNRVDGKGWSAKRNLKDFNYVMFSALDSGARIIKKFFLLLASKSLFFLLSTRTTLNWIWIFTKNFASLPLTRGEVYASQVSTANQPRNRALCRKKNQDDWLSLSIWITFSLLLEFQRSTTRKATNRGNQLRGILKAAKKI